MDYECVVDVYVIGFFLFVILWSKMGNNTAMKVIVKDNIMFLLSIET